MALYATSFLDVGIEVPEAREIHARDILDHLPCDVRDGPASSGFRAPSAPSQSSAWRRRAPSDNAGEALDRAACRSRDLALRAVSHGYGTPPSDLNAAGNRPSSSWSPMSSAPYRNVASL